MPKKGPPPRKRPRQAATDAAPNTEDARDQSDARKLADDQPSETAGFTPRTLDRSVIAIPLLRDLVAEGTTQRFRAHDVVIDLHLEYPGGRDKARERVRQLVAALPI